ncbi:Aldo/keto reductase [Stereum hirsutum FP-91666 SS1]|uniref:Aldo/keto reductase n=1 Tax=Stereum hirsutum (strain FP-91666) TaxID=721885 RepID=UPI000440EE76|nr:Aldo/keto reductase [Stereum hirsutum FP-91666 SS1]EIM90875.1 Aldo/keto reductase [Stereum hirsutum FP-91666 SS1]
MSTLSLSSAVKLPSGYMMKLLGFGVYKNYDAKPSCLEALAAGYRHIDSAQMYRNEAEVGEAIRASGIPREDVFVTTKIESKDHGYENTLKGVDESLKRFGFDYIDLFLIHDPFSGPEKRIATYKALLKSRDEGKIRTVGVSNFGIKHLEEIVSSGLELPAVNQLEIHPFCQQRPIVKWCRDHGVVIEAYCPVIRGKMDDPVFLDIARKHGNRDPAQILIRWSLQHGYVPLPKSATPARIRSNANLYDFSLDEEDMERIDALDKGDAGAISWNPIHAP